MAQIPAIVNGDAISSTTLTNRTNGIADTYTDRGATVLETGCVHVATTSLLAGDHPANRAVVQHDLMDTTYLRPMNGQWGSTNFPVLASSGGTLVLVTLAGPYGTWTTFVRFGTAALEGPATVGLFAEFLHGNNVATSGIVFIGAGTDYGAGVIVRAGATRARHVFTRDDDTAATEVQIQNAAYLLYTTFGVLLLGKLEGGSVTQILIPASVRFASVGFEGSGGNMDVQFFLSQAYLKALDLDLDYEIALLPVVADSAGVSPTWTPLLETLYISAMVIPGTLA
jgi:hypothetical protein